MSRNYQRIYDPDWWPVAVNSSRDKEYISCCPVCGWLWDSSRTDRRFKLTYLCGGEWVHTVDQDGRPCVTGRCGSKLSQQLLLLEE